MGEIMKIVFLDIDGVLNSWRYDQVRMSLQDNIDETRLPLLYRIVSSTGAKIVLTSSWRKHWERDFNKADSIGQHLNELFEEYGLAIFDKTIESSDNNRTDEIRDWLANNSVEQFVIVDDIAFGCDELEPHLMRTNYRIGRGLHDSHVSQAISILNGGN